LASTVAPKGIPRNLIGEWKIDQLAPMSMPQLRAQLLEAISKVPRLQDPKALQKSLSIMEELGLIRSDTRESFSFVHPHSQLVFRRLSEKVDRLGFIRIMLSRIWSTTSIDSHDESTWPAFTALFPHLEAIAEQCDELRHQSPLLGKMLLAVGGY